MHEGVSLDLAVRLQTISDEPSHVIDQRSRLLGLRGLTEMLVQQGENAHHLLCCGRYQASLRVEVPNKLELAESSARKLAQIVEALSQQVGILEQALDDFDALSVVRNASRLGIIVISEELDDHARRIARVKNLVREWRTALAR